jgi:hypothetical protein
MAGALLRPGAQFLCVGARYHVKLAKSQATALSAPALALLMRPAVHASSFLHTSAAAHGFCTAPACRFRRWRNALLTVFIWHGFKARVILTSIPICRVNQQNDRSFWLEERNENRRPAAASNESLARSRPWSQPLAPSTSTAAALRSLLSGAPPQRPRAPSLRHCRAARLWTSQVLRTADGF